MEQLDLFLLHRHQFRPLLFAQRIDLPLHHVFGPRSDFGTAWTATRVEGFAEPRQNDRNPSNVAIRSGEALIPLAFEMSCQAEDLSRCQHLIGRL